MFYGVRSSERTQSFNPAIFRHSVAFVIIAFSVLVLNGCSGLSVPASAASHPSSDAKQLLLVVGTFPPAALTLPYNASISVIGGTAPYQFSLASGKLPAGLFFASAGTISGTPTTAGNFNFTISVVDSRRLSAQQTFEITVSSAARVVVVVNPATASVASGGSLQLSALVSNTPNLAVSWNATVGSISHNGLYTAPQVTSAANATITATSAADPTQSATASITITAPVNIGIALAPSSLTLASGALTQFTSLVTNTTNTAVSWSATQGEISASGLYSAPRVTSNTTDTVTVTSVADPTKSAKASITVTANSAPVSVTVTPSTAAVSSGASFQFSALVVNSSSPSVTWKTTTGTISTNGLFTAPHVTSNTIATITATSVADATKSASASVNVAAMPVIGVSVTPASITLSSGASTQFSALVSNTSNVAVAWSATKGTITSSGNYTAPQVKANIADTVTATSVADSTKAATALVTVTAISVTPLSITSTSPSSATTGTAYSYSFAATGGKSPFAWTLSAGTLPSGFTLQSSGSVSGTTMQAGSFPFTLKATDSSSPPQTAVKSFSLTVSSSGGSGPRPSASFFGFSENSTGTKNFPSVSYGMQRFWDSPPLQWPSLNTAPGVFNFSTLDSALGQAYSAGVMEGMYTLARTPPWATSRPSDTTCHYTTAAFGGGNGECDAPSDLNADGSGTNATWKAWITAIATHANDSAYLQSHAHIKYWEVWNEPDTQPFWAGSIAQLARLTEDANCIITGRGVIHESGNGTATSCTATAIDASAQIVMASAHAKGAALTFGQNELYCNHTTNMPSYQLPCPNPPNAVANAVDIINFHMKPGNESGNNCPAPTPCTPENAMTMYVSNVEGILQPAERAKPLWNGEAAYSEYGFSGAYTDADMAASFMPRYYLMNWSLGISGNAWYAWDALAAQPASVRTAYQQAYDWMANSSLDTPCTASGTVWSCTVSKSGTQYLIMWDSAQSCSAGVCTSSTQTVGSQWSTYEDITLVGAQVPISSHTVSVGIKPIAMN